MRVRILSTYGWFGVYTPQKCTIVWISAVTLFLREFGDTIDHLLRFLWEVIINLASSSITII